MRMGGAATVMLGSNIWVALGSNISVAVVVGWRIKCQLLCERSN